VALREVAPLGRQLGRPVGPLKLLEVHPLTTVQLILVADVLTHRSHQAYVLSSSRSPEMQPCHPTLLQQLTMDPDGTLAFQEPDRMGHAVLGGMLKHRWTWSGIACLLAVRLPVVGTIPRTADSVRSLP